MLVMSGTRRVDSQLRVASVIGADDLIRARDAFKTALCALVLTHGVACAPINAATPGVVDTVVERSPPLPVGTPLQIYGRLNEGLRWRIDVCGADGDVVGAVDPRAAQFVIEQGTSRRAGEDCVFVVLDLLATADALGARDAAVVVGDNVVVASPDVWLWTTTPPRAARLTVEAAEGLDVVVPFPRGADGRFDVDTTTWRWLSSAVFGAVATHTVALDDGKALRMVILPGRLTMSTTDVAEWVRAAGNAVAMGGAGGGFPVHEALVVVDPVGGDGVPFGMVSRGGGPQALLLLRADPRLHDLRRDWLPVHELSHLLAPPFGLDEAWLSEGLATYHQSVLRARAGLLTSTAAWAVLVDGFRRGERASRSTSLLAASASMRRDGGYLQVYQGGAAVVLVVDVALRRCGSSIDAVVTDLRTTRQSDRRLAAADVVARAAAIAGCAEIAAIFDAAVRAPFAAVDAVLGDLGVDIDDGRVVQPSASAAAIREAIMAGDLSMPR